MSASVIRLTKPKRSDSSKAVLQRRIAAFIADEPTAAGWTSDGFRADISALSRVSSLTDPKDVRVGSVATGLDMWAAWMLRVAGISNVVPRESEPFFVAKAAADVLDQFDSIDDELSALEQVRVFLSRSGQVAQERILSQRMRRLTTLLRRVRSDLERGTTAVLGESRRKQVDVFVADWDRGLELLISTKSFALAANPNEIVKNLPNRLEEFDGDLKNLRGRFPLAAIGALTIVPAEVLNGTLPAFVDMMTKVTAPGRPWVNSYDRAAIVIAEPWAVSTGESVQVLNGQIDPAQLPNELQPEFFFNALLSKLLERSPITEHFRARVLRAEALGQDSSSIVTAAEATRSAIKEDAPDYDGVPSTKDIPILT